MINKATFVWPQEPYLPTSLFKHYAYLGETAAYARKFGEVKIVDLSVQKKARNDLISIIESSDFILIPVEAYTVRSAVGLAELAKQCGRSRTIAYGTIPSMNPFFFRDYFDAIVITGHYERAFERLLQDPESFFEKCDTGIFSESRPLDPDSWPYPPLSLLPLTEYLQISPNQIEINTQKGCLFNCSFCAEKTLIPERKIYVRSPENLVKFLASNPEFDFYIDATTFTQDREWARETCRGLINLDFPVRWKTVTRIDQLDEETVKLMSKAGCYKIGFGVETTSRGLQKSIRKQISKSTIREGVNLLKKYEIVPRAFLMLGIPGQTAEDIMNTYKFLTELDAEQRWKEYVPIDKIPFIKELKDFEQFERNSYRFHRIEGLDAQDYIKLIQTRR